MSFFGSRNSILALTVVTALIHLVLGLGSFPDFFGIIFLLNALGFLTLMYALLWKPSFLKGQEGMVRWVFLGFTALTFVLYFVFQGPDAFRNVIGLVTKLDEALLIVSLWRYQS
ncbi:MAG: hypothetical protein H6636_08300 [Anaerolineales bacterium]|nr:hypothetical protein [Anaerolineales bacterium]